MRSIPLLIEAKPLAGYVVNVRFEDGTTSDVYAHAQRRTAATA